MLQVENRGRKIIVDQEIKACGICKRTWQKVSYRIYKKHFLIYPLGHIPRLGKEIKTCPRCAIDRHK